LPAHSGTNSNQPCCRVQIPDEVRRRSEKADG
jgi:hypothetical protein